MADRRARDADAEAQLDAWRADPAWAEVVPSVQVSNPKGTFCQLDCSALVALPPEHAFSLLCDPGNSRVFRSVKGVRNRRVLEDEGGVTTVQMELVAGWRFLVFSGEFSVHMRLVQDRPNMKVHFELVDAGFMRHFKGTWSVEPVPVAPSPENLSPPPANNNVSTPTSEAACRMASRVCLVQSVQPAVNPPPILAQYLRHIAASALRESFHDIQAEAARTRYGLPEGANVQAELRKKGVCLDVKVEESFGG